MVQLYILSIHSTLHTATFTDDTAIMAVNKNPYIASSELQPSLNEIHEWLQLRRIMANEEKSVHITFTLKKAECPSISLNGSPVP